MTNPTSRADPPAAAAEVFFTISPDVLAVIDLEGRFVEVNPAWERLGYSPEMLIGTHWSAAIHVEDRAGLALPQPAEPVSWSERRVNRSDGAHVWMEWGMFTTPDGATYAIGRDIGVRKQLEKRLGDSDREFYDLVENAADAILTADADGRLTSLNGAAERITGYARGEVIGMPLGDLVAPESRALVDPLQSLQPEGGEPSVLEVELLRKDGERIPVELNTRVKYVDGRPVQIQGIARNIMLRKRLIDELRERNEELRNANRTIHSLMNQDPLTLLPNRRQLESALHREITRSRRDGTPLGLILCDIDRFKRINDSFGHAAGDEVLSAFGSMLLLSCRKQDTPARYGGEEFIVLLPDTSLSAAVELADRLRAQAERLSVPSGATITVSFGVTELRIGDTAADFINRADGALYAAKEQGRNQVVSS